MPAVLTAQFLSGFGWLTVVCLAAGIVLLIIEMLLPGFGVPGIAGALMLVIGIASAAGSLREALLLSVIVLAVLAAAGVLFFKSAGSRLFWRSPIVLKNRAVKEEGYTTSADKEVLLGKKGKTVTVLRPAGIACFEGERIDVVTEAAFIDENTEVIVIAVHGSRVVVRATEGEQNY